MQSTGQSWALLGGARRACVGGLHLFLSRIIDQTFLLRMGLDSSLHVANPMERCLAFKNWDAQLWSRLLYLKL